MIEQAEMPDCKCPVCDTYNATKRQIDKYNKETKKPDKGIKMKRNKISYWKKHPEIKFNIDICRHGHIYCTCEKKFRTESRKHLEIGMTLKVSAE